MEDLTVPAIFYRAVTTADGGWRISFDVDASNAHKVAIMTALRDELLNLTVKPVNQNEGAGDRYG